MGKRNGIWLYQYWIFNQPSEWIDFLCEIKFVFAFAFKCNDFQISSFLPVNQIDSVVISANKMHNNGILGNYKIRERTKVRQNVLESLYIDIDRDLSIEYSVLGNGSMLSRLRSSLSNAR